MKAALGDALRRLWSNPWAWSTNRGVTAGDRILTSTFLRIRIVLLPALAVLTLACAATAYFHVHNRTVHVRDQLLPALVQLSQARAALDLAHKEAVLRLGAPDEAPPAQTELVGLGDRYQSLLTEAEQGINTATQNGALDQKQEQELRVVSGLITAYGEKIDWAAQHTVGTDPRLELRNAGLSYAVGMLCDSGTEPVCEYHRGLECRHSDKDNDKEDEPSAVQDRIQKLRIDLLCDSIDSQAQWVTLLSWGIASVVVLALFIIVLCGTHVFLWEKWRLRGKPLAVAGFMVLAVPALLAVGALQEFGAQREVARRIDTLAAEKSVTGGTRKEIEDHAKGLYTTLGEAHPSGWFQAATVALGVGAAGALGCGVVLHRYGREHLRLRKGPLS